VLTEDKLKGTGISQYGIIAAKDIEFSDEIRKICEDNSCRLYAKTWACPPAVGTVAQCKERCRQYSTALVFCAVYNLEDSFDYDAMVSGHREFKKLCDRLYALVKEDHMDFLLLSNEGCIRCKACSYPDSPCRMPQLLFPSLEGYGINVMRLAEKADVAYNNGQNTVTYFGMVLFKERVIIRSRLGN
jgi:predicted metal-binding protein